MGMLQDADVNVYIENVLNFPTYAESYRAAALDAHAKLASFDAESESAA